MPSKYLLKEGEHLVLAYAKGKKKKPIGGSGWRSHKPTYEEAQQHIDKGPPYYVGVFPHSVGLVCIDLDSPEDEVFILNNFPKLVRNTLLECNSLNKIGDWQKKHLWVATNNDWRKFKLPTGGDVISTSNYVTLYGDEAERLRDILNDKTGKYNYKLSAKGRSENDKYIIQIQEAVVRNVDIDDLKREIAGEGVADEDGFKEGTRNDTLFRKFCRILEDGGTKQEQAALIKKALASGLTWDDVEATVKSAKNTVIRKGKVLADSDSVGTLSDLIKKIKKKSGTVRERKRKKSSQSKAADWLEKNFSGLEFIRVAGMDSEPKGLRPIFWNVHNRKDEQHKKERGTWSVPETNLIGQLIQLKYPEAKAEFIREVRYQLSLREGRTSHISRWDVDDRYLGLKDGWLWDFENCSIIEQEKGIKISNHTPCLPDRAADNMMVSNVDPLEPKSYFEKCVIDWVREPNCDANRIIHRANMLQMIMGYSLIAGNPQNYVFFHWGETGGNGKSIFFHAIRCALGRNLVSALSAKALTMGQSVHDTTLNKLIKSRIAISEEILDMRKLNVPELKKLSGEDLITVRALYEDQRDEICAATIHIPTNPHPKRCRAFIDDLAWKRRVIVFPWRYRIPDKDRDPAIKRKLEEESGTILRWLLEGWVKYVQNGFHLNVENDMLLSQERDEDSDDGDTVDDTGVTDNFRSLKAFILNFIGEDGKQITVDEICEQAGVKKTIKSSKLMRNIFENNGYVKRQIYVGKNKKWGFVRHQKSSPVTEDLFSE